jgi:hypothetical protein
MAPWNEKRPQDKREKPMRPDKVAKENRPSDGDYVRPQTGYNMHQQHWEMKYHQKPQNNSENSVMGSQFNPLNTKYRYKTYVPVNETDT